MGAGSAELEARRAPPRVHGIPGRRERVQGPSDGPRVAGASSPNGGAQVNRTGSGALPDAGLSRTLTMADHGVVPTGPATDKAAALLALHTGSGFVLPNAWDAGSARVLEQVGFPAIATTSAGIAWACGVPDGAGFGRDRMLEHIGAIVAAVGVPVSADLEDGYGDTPDEVGRTVARAVEVGAVGANIEDAGNGRLYGIDEAVDRVAAARAAAPSGTFVLNARTDTYFVGVEGDAFAETVERAHRYLDAGADCIFVPGVAEADTIRRLAERHPRPAQRGGRAGEHHRRAHAVLARGETGQPGREPGPGLAQPSSSAPAASCSTPAPSASSTVPSATPTCSAASRP